MKIKNNAVKADAILWDFDGTLADSAAKNIAITKKILEQVAPHMCGDNLPRSLSSKAEYHIANHKADHWRDLYSDHFGLTSEEIEIAGPMWAPHQMLDQTEVTLFDGVAETVEQFAGYPQGICSANASPLIRQVLERYNVHHRFQSVIGYENLPETQQKPAPDGGLICMAELFEDPRDKTIVFIGDHIADVIFARGLEQKLGPSNTVVSAIVTYSGANPQTWAMQPDVVFEHISDLRDWVSQDEN